MAQTLSQATRNVIANIDLNVSVHRTFRNKNTVEKEKKESKKKKKENRKGKEKKDERKTYFIRLKNTPRVKFLIVKILKQFFPENLCCSIIFIS